MTQAGEQDTWPELLLEFATGELDRARSEALEAHLRSCADCRSELAAVRALRDEPDSKMTTAERAELHRALQESSQSAGDVVPLASRPLSERPLMRRLAPALGAAALLIIGGVAVLQGDLLGGSDGPAGGGSAGSESQVALEDEGAAAPGPLGSPMWLGDLGRTSLGEVAALARSRPSTDSVRRAFRTTPTADQKLQKNMDLAEVLAPQAPAELRSSIRSCVEEVSSQFNDSRLLPAFGAQGRLEGSKVLFVGFVTSSSGSRPDQLAVWAFEPDSCAPLGYQASRFTRGDP